MRDLASRLWAAFSLSMRDRLRYRGEVFATCAFLGVLVFIFSRLWHTVADQGTLTGPYSVAQLVLYLVVAELVILAPPNTHLRISDDVKSGGLSVQLLRPVPYVPWELSRELGASAVRLVTLFALGFPAAFLLGGRPPLDPRGLLVGLLLLVPAAVVVECMARMLVGLLAFWIEDSNPLYWIWQKATFVLGGLMLPIDLYPDWLRSVTRVLPFEALLYGPARTVVSYDATFARWALIKLGLWGAVMLMVLQIVYLRGRRQVQVNGG